PQAMARARWTYLIRSGRLGETAPDLRTMFSYESVLDDMAFIFSPSISIALAAAIAPVAGMVCGGVAFAVGVVLLCTAKSTEPHPGWSQAGAAGNDADIVDVADAADAVADVAETVRPLRRARSPRGRLPSLRQPSVPSKSLLATSEAVRVLFVIYAFAGSFLGLFDTATVSLSEDLNSPDFAGAVLMASGAVSMTAGFLFGMVRLRAPLPKQLVVAACAVGLSFGTMFLIDSAPTLMAVALLERAPMRRCSSWPTGSASAPCPTRALPRPSRGSMPVYLRAASGPPWPAPHRHLRHHGFLQGGHASVLGHAAYGHTRYRVVKASILPPTRWWKSARCSGRSRDPSSLLNSCGIR
ncbi:MAG: hypothetical protein ACLSDQ_10470, partial [Adlercreutzia equolifaciens]